MINGDSSETDTAALPDSIKHKGDLERQGQSMESLLIDTNAREGLAVAGGLQSKVQSGVAGSQPGTGKVKGHTGGGEEVVMDTAKGNEKPGLGLLEGRDAGKALQDEVLSGTTEGSQKPQKEENHFRQGTSLRDLLHQNKDHLEEIRMEGEG
ncbi:unnamed protein product, partial [Discosporangium mesarthrocarpum]